MSFQLPSGGGSLCISVAARPGRFGITVHNAGYHALGLDFFYMALKVKDIGAVTAAVRALGIRGCSVSMPFKETVIPHLDVIDTVATRVGAVNTVVNDGGRLTGYNTDVIGARRALEILHPQIEDRVLILGAGGAARAILTALDDFSLHNRILCARRSEVADRLGREFGTQIAAWEDRGRVDASILINATPIGMFPDHVSTPIDPEHLSHFRAVMDTVATPSVSTLIQTARNQGIPASDGLTMALHQACAQFSLYTGHMAPFEVMRKAALALM